METDFVDSLGLLALATRFRRASDILFNEVADIYHERGVEFSPRWFPLLRLFAEREPLPVTRAAEVLRLTQPAISQIAAEMVQAGLVEARVDAGDERRRLLTLTAAGRAQHGRLQPVWRWIEAAVTEATYEAEADLLMAMRRFEATLARRGLAERVRAMARAAEAPLELVDFTTELRGHWYSLNAEWIRAEYVLEPADEAMLRDPEGAVLAGGGAIVFARAGGEVVGTCGLLRLEAEVDFELMKLAVTPAARGRGAARLLAQRIVELARQRGARRVLIETNQRARAGIALYRTMGFVDVPRWTDGGFSRSNVFMALTLNGDSAGAAPAGNA